MEMNLASVAGWWQTIKTQNHLKTDIENDSVSGYFYCTISWAWVGLRGVDVRKVRTNHNLHAFDAEKKNETLLHSPSMAELCSENSNNFLSHVIIFIECNESRSVTVLCVGGKDFCFHCMLGNIVQVCILWYIKSWPIVLLSAANTYVFPFSSGPELKLCLTHIRPRNLFENDWYGQWTYSPATRAY